MRRVQRRRIDDVEVMIQQRRRRASTIGFRDNLVYALRLTRAPLVRLSSRNLCNQTRQAPYSSRWFAKAACRAILVRNRFRKAAPRASVSHAAAPVSSSSKAIVPLTKHSSL